MRNRIRNLGALVWVALAALLQACASQPPSAIQFADALAVSVAEVRAQPRRYAGERVRWGGEVLGVRNLKRHSWLEVLARPLYSLGEPMPERPAEGRFLVKADGFLDPMEYKKGESVTVVGRLSALRNRNVGQYEYAYPVVSAESLYLWPREARPVRRRHRGFIHDPFFWDPWHPFYSPWGHPYWW